MTEQPRWVPEAIEDLQNGREWYDEREPGLGRSLVVEVFKALDQATQHPFVLRRYEHPNLPAAPEVRRYQLAGFDEYSLVYAVVDHTFWVLAISHAKRKPAAWAERLTRLS